MRPRVPAAATRRAREWALGRGLRETSDAIDFASLRPPFDSPERVRALSETPADEAFITGNGLAARCRHVLNYDVLTTNEAGSEDWWFCKADYLEHFFSHHRPRERYVLFSHNSDRPIDRRFRRVLDDPLLVAWFAENPVFRHPKLKAFPIGVANPFWAHGNQAALKEVQAEAPPKRLLFDASFNPATNPAERHRCVVKTGIEAGPRLPYEDYLRRLASSRFRISPSGNGIDVHATWEALYLRTVPIVTRSILAEQHADLPMIVLDDWSRFRSIDYSPELYERVWKDWDPVELRLDRYLERVERTLEQLS